MAWRKDLTGPVHKVSRVLKADNLDSDGDPWYLWVCITCPTSVVGYGEKDREQAKEDARIHSETGTWEHMEKKNG